MVKIMPNYIKINTTTKTYKSSTISKTNHLVLNKRTTHHIILRPKVQIHTLPYPCNSKQNNPLVYAPNLLAISNHKKIITIQVISCRLFSSIAPKANLCYLKTPPKPKNPQYATTTSDQYLYISPSYPSTALSYFRLPLLIATANKRESTLSGYLKAKQTQIGQPTQSHEADTHRSIPNGKYHPLLS
jgi:hypothetical protein